MLKKSFLKIAVIHMSPLFDWRNKETLVIFELTSLKDNDFPFFLTEKIDAVEKSLSSKYVIQPSYIYHSYLIWFMKTFPFKGIGNEVLRIFKKSALAFSLLYNELELTLLNCFPTESYLPLYELVLNIMVKQQCFRHKQNMLFLKMKQKLIYFDTLKQKT